MLADAIAGTKGAGGSMYSSRPELTSTAEDRAEGAEAGVTPKEFVDQVAGEIKNIWDLMNTSYDKFIRTTDEDHEKQVQKILRSCTIREIFTKDPMRDSTVRPVNPSGPSPSWWTANVRTAGAR